MSCLFVIFVVVVLLVGCGSDGIDIVLIMKVSVGCFVFML